MAIVVAIRPALVIAGVTPQGQEPTPIAMVNLPAVGLTLAVRVEAIVVVRAELIVAQGVAPTREEAIAVVPQAATVDHTPTEPGHTLAVQAGVT